MHVELWWGDVWNITVWKAEKLIRYVLGKQVLSTGGGLIG